MAKIGTLQVTSFTAAREPWAQFQKLAQSQNLTSSALLRLIIVKELRRAARQLAAETK
jgi:hypothetical protein